MNKSWHVCSYCQAQFQSDGSNPEPSCPSCRAAASKRWYYARNRQKEGPVTLAGLARLAAAGELCPGDMVLSEGASKWMRADAVPGVFAAHRVSSAALSESPPRTPDTIDDSRQTVSSPLVSRTADGRRVALPDIPGFELLGLLGRGGMGVVYKARQTALKRIVALKMVLSGDSADASELSRFRTEAEAAARLKHPNVVQVYEVGMHEGRPYCVLEYVEGGTLSAALASTPIPPRDAAQVVRALAGAVDAAHRTGIVHRDLKPSNVLLSNVPGTTLAGAAPKVADFGLAKRLDEDSGQTRTGVVVGTPSYMAPEQASGRTKDLGPACDIYSLGAILYECLTGRPPFKGATPMETLDQVRSREPAPPRSLQPSVPLDLETICLKCLHKDAAQRYSSAGALADDLDRYLGNRPILARRAGVFERSVKFSRRNPLLVGGSSLVFVLLLLWAVTASVQARRERTAREGEQQALQQHRTQLAETLAVNAQGLRQRGQLTEAIKEIDRAIEAGHPRTAALLLDKAKSLETLNRADEARALLDEIEKREDSAMLTGQIYLLRADVAEGEDRKRVVEWTRSALDLGLPDGDRHYALALLADSSPKAIEHLRHAIKADPYHHSARGILGATLLLSGRMDEARAVAHESKGIYPDDPSFRVLAALTYAFRGNLPLAREEIHGIGRQLDPQAVARLEATLEVLADWSTIDFNDPGFKTKWAGSWLKLAPHLAQMSAKTPLDAKDPTPNLARLSRSIRVPPFLERIAGNLTSAFLQFIRGNIDDETIRIWKETLDAHPEGALRAAYGNMLVFRKRLAEAEREFLRAAEEPALVSMRRPLLFSALSCERDLIDPEITRNVKPDCVERARRNLHEVIRLDRFRVNEAHELLDVALLTKEFDAARWLLAQWNRTAPMDEDLRHYRLALALHTDDFMGIIEGVGPNSTDPDRSAARARAIQALEAYVQRQKAAK